MMKTVAAVLHQLEKQIKHLWQKASVKIQRENAVCLQRMKQKEGKAALENLEHEKMVMLLVVLEDTIQVVLEVIIQVEAKQLVEEALESQGNQPLALVVVMEEEE